ncbi:MAG: redoxin domain-containing protein, partial [Nanoarchaeota archaeon]
MKSHKNKIYLLIALIIIISAIVYFEKMRPDIQTNKNTELKDGKYPKAPELVGISGYLNTEEGLKISDLKGKVVLIDFWTYSCINCLRTLPHIKEWYSKYKDKGLVIIGVHTPEFEFEKKYDNVKMAIEDNKIEYPVIQDNDYATWTSFKNRYWP